MWRAEACDGPGEIQSGEDEGRDEAAADVVLQPQISEWIDAVHVAQVQENREYPYRESDAEICRGVSQTRLADLPFTIYHSDLPIRRTG